MITRSKLNRRRALGTLLATPGFCSLNPSLRGHAEDEAEKGLVIGEPTGAKVGMQVLADGGNAFDAIVAAALACTIAGPHQTGIGGYGAHAVLAVEGGRVLYALDANSDAPSGLKADAFRPNEKGVVPGRVNETGWLSAGVPGILAGLELVLKRFGTQSFSDMIQPAIDLARNGIRLPQNVCATIAGSQTMRSDTGSRGLYFRDGNPPRPDQLFRNPELAEMLTVLARANSADAFYRGDIAQQIAESFAKNGGLVTAADMARYRPRLTAPVSMRMGDTWLATAPLTAGGVTVFQILLALQQLDWQSLQSKPRASRYLVEVGRLAWHDRLTLLGDTDHVKVPLDRLLSTDYALQSADRIRRAVEVGKPIEYPNLAREQGGTISLSAADKSGNYAALTLTHGGAFGSQVTVERIGVTLGHGMSRFDPRPDHPNAPGPGKRPLNNMVPVIAMRNGRARLALGGRGGRKIPNAVLGYLMSDLYSQADLRESLNAPRMHTEGSLALKVEKGWDDADRQSLSQFGYQVKTAASATLSAVANESGKIVGAMR